MTTRDKYQQADLDVIDAAERVLATLNPHEFDTGNDSLNGALVDMSGCLQHRDAVQEGRANGNPGENRRCDGCRPEDSYVASIGAFCHLHGKPFRSFPRPMHGCGYPWKRTVPFCNHCGQRMGDEPGPGPQANF